MLIWWLHGNLQPRSAPPPPPTPGKCHKLPRWVTMLPSWPKSEHGIGFPRLVVLILIPRSQLYNYIGCAMSSTLKFPAHQIIVLTWMRLALVIYEYVITLHLEISIFWTNFKFTAVSILFIFTRLNMVGLAAFSLTKPHSLIVSLLYYLCSFWLTHLLILQELVDLLINHNIYFCHYLGAGTAIL